MITEHKQSSGSGYEIQIWAKQGCSEADRLIGILSSLPFLTDNFCDFSIEEAQILIGVLFPTKATKVYVEKSTYHLKHLFETISCVIGGIKHGGMKYCAVATLVYAFQQQGFAYRGTGVHWYMNLSAKEVNNIYRCFGHLHHHR